MVLTLKLLMLFIATTSSVVAAADTEFLVIDLAVVVGTQRYICDTNSKTYV